MSTIHDQTMSSWSRLQERSTYLQSLQYQVYIMVLNHRKVHPPRQLRIIPMHRQNLQPLRPAIAPRKAEPTTIIVVFQELHSEVCHLAVLLEIGLVPHAARPVSVPLFDVGGGDVRGCHFGEGVSAWTVHSVRITAGEGKVGNWVGGGGGTPS